MNQVQQHGKWFHFQTFNVIFIDLDREKVLRRAAQFSRQMIDQHWR